MSNITLSEAIRAIRAELIESAATSQGECIRFVPNTVEIELTVTFSREAEAGGGFKLLSLVDLSGKTKLSDSNIHKVKLMLEPVRADGSPTLVNDER
jgi:hypothetical protein